MECDLRMGDHWTMTSASSTAIGVLQLDTHSNHVVDLSYMSNKSKVNTRYLLSDFFIQLFYFILRMLDSCNDSRLEHLNDGGRIS